MVRKEIIHCFFLHFIFISGCPSIFPFALYLLCRSSVLPYRFRRGWVASGGRQAAAEAAPAAPIGCPTRRSSTGSSSCTGASARSRSGRDSPVSSPSAPETRSRSLYRALGGTLLGKQSEANKKQSTYVFLSLIAISSLFFFKTRISLDRFDRSLNVGLGVAVAFVGPVALGRS